MSENDATPAYRGYRLQALYLMKRILNSKDGLLFTPEGVEDLSIANNGKTIEIIQVKSYDGLVLSDLEPSKENSFFHRVAPAINANEKLNISLVNIGRIGPELQGAWDREEKHRKSVEKKLKEHGFEDFEILNFFERIQLSHISEVSLRAEIDDRLRELLPGVDTQHAFDLLQKWLYDLSENRSAVSQRDLIEKIQNIGRFLDDRVQFHSEWFTNITPVETENILGKNKSELRDEFFAGVSTRFEHILADLDFLRPSKMEEIKHGFLTENIVLIHGASGQGKSTLAYRYLYENYPKQLCYQIHIIEDREHALKVTRALSGYAEALETPIVVYFDVKPRDQGWAELLTNLAEHPYIQILVTVREEDFNRANISYTTQFADITLELYKDEAIQLYQRAKDKRIDVDFLSFEDAWDVFGGEGGPLLEFVYLLTQTKTLFQRLEEQIKRLKTEVRETKLSPSELELLRLVAIVTAYGGRVDLHKLLQQLHLPEPSTTLNFYEKEYLLRISVDQQYIEALHPIRSSILMKLLVIPGIDSWGTLIEKALLVTYEIDWEMVLLAAYINHQEMFDELVSITLNLSPVTWSGVAGVLRCLLWVGAKRYIETNRQVIDRSKNVMGKGLFWIVMDLNFLGPLAKDMDNWWESLHNIISQEKIDEIQQIRKEQSPKQDVFNLASEWLSQKNAPTKPPHKWLVWQDVSEVLYWASRFQFGMQVSRWLLVDDLVKSFSSLDLPTLSKILFSLFICDPVRYQDTLGRIDGDLRLRLAREYRIFVLEEKGNTLTLHFLAYPTDDIQNTEISKESNNKVHDETILRIELARKLFPDFEIYGSSGYGHKIPGLEILSDESIKNIPYHLFPPEWGVRLNSLTSGLIRNEMRLGTWNEYLDQVLEIRQLNVRNLELVCQSIYRYFQKEKAVNFLDAPPFSTEDWSQGLALLSDLPLLPKVSTDPWGIGQPEGGEKSNRDEINNEDKASPSKLRLSILQKKYRDYLTAERECLGKLSTFYQQSQHVMVLNIRCGKEPENSPQRLATVAELEENGVVPRNQLLSKINIWEAYWHLKSYQLEFRRLFAEKVEEHVLVELEKKEQDTFESLLWAWFIFADESRTSLGNPKKQILQRVNNTYESIVHQVIEVTSSSEFNFGNTQILAENMEWENSSAIWIQLDIQSPLGFGEKFDKFLFALRDVFALSQYGDYLYSLVEVKLHYVVILPTIQGKSIDGNIYPLRTTMVFMQEHKIEEKPYLYVPYKISDDMLSILNVDKWHLENIKEVNEFETSFSVLMAKLTMLAQIEEMPRIRDDLQLEFQSYMDQRAAELTEAFQTFMSVKKLFAEYLEGFSQEDTLEIETLMDAKEALADLNDILLVDEDGNLQLSLYQLKDYSGQLQEISQAILGLKLIWVNLAIEKEP